MLKPGSNLYVRNKYVKDIKESGLFATGDVSKSGWGSRSESESPWIKFVNKFSEAMGPLIAAVVITAIGTCFVIGIKVGLGVKGDKEKLTDEINEKIREVTNKNKSGREVEKEVMLIRTDFLLEMKVGLDVKGGVELTDRVAEKITHLTSQGV